ncbi:MAG: GNAT family N-acetyltransferase [Chitinophagaceae bacterium]|nr:GNAT family N-acetyltransferase [Oligoflexus sp.]
MPSLLYSEAEGELSALSQFCQNVLRDSFWPVEEFSLSLKIPQTFLLYRPSSVSNAWQGFALGRVMGGTAELFFIFVHPDVRGQGLASAILSDFEAYSLNTFQAVSVLLEVRISNDAAIRLYERSGYKRIHTRKRYYQDGEDAALYEKPLPSEKKG